MNKEVHITLLEIALQLNLFSVTYFLVVFKVNMKNVSDSIKLLKSIAECLFTSYTNGQKSDQIKSEQIPTLISMSLQIIKQYLK